MKREKEEDAIEERNCTYERKKEKRRVPEKGRMGWSTIFIN
jgi:hypothetical protein